MLLASVPEVAKASVTVSADDAGSAHCPHFCDIAIDLHSNIRRNLLGFNGIADKRAFGGEVRKLAPEISGNALQSASFNAVASRYEHPTFNVRGSPAMSKESLCLSVGVSPPPKIFGL
jgi:hypothetical protein